MANLNQVPKKSKKEIVYQLSGYDVIAILAEKGKLKNLSPDEVSDVIAYVKRKLEIPSDEYLDATLDTYFDYKAKNNLN